MFVYFCVSLCVRLPLSKQVQVHTFSDSHRKLKKKIDKQPSNVERGRYLVGYDANNNPFFVRINRNVYV